MALLDWPPKRGSKTSLADDRRLEVANPRHFHLAYADALRATAILIVLLQHLILVSGPIAHAGHAYSFSYLGVWGVNCFFVLSGYLLGRPYVAMLLDPERPRPSTVLFYTRRFLRIYPLYAVALIVSALVVRFSSGAWPTPQDVVSHVLMVHSFSTDVATSLNGPLWTMSVDAEFYALLPICAALLATALRGRSVRIRRNALVATLATVFVGSIVFHYEMIVHVPATVHDFTLAVVLVRNIVGFAGAFAVGVFLAVGVLLLRERVPQRPAFFLTSVAVGGAIAAVQLLVRTDAVGAPTHAQAIYLAFDEALAAVSVGLIFFGISEGKLPIVTRLTRARVVTSVAALSYAIYLVHWPILDAIWKALHRPTGPGGFVELAAIAGVVVMAVAYVLHVTIERPLLRVKDGLRESSQGT